MKILFVSAEVAPYVSVGGLSQVMYFLPQALRSLGHDVRIFTAKYGTMDETAPKKGWDFKTEFTGLHVPIDDDVDKSIICNIKSLRNRADKIVSYFLENQEYYELRANVYGYRDDHTRFALLSKGCLEWLLQTSQTESKEEAWFPDIIHAHDWHTGYFPDFARRYPRYQHLLENTPLVYTVHNFSLQGNYDFRYAQKEKFDYGQTLLAPLTDPLLQEQNALKRGIITSDAINTVSPTHSVEILTPEYAEGLEKTLHEVRGKVTGILNGLNTVKFNPSTDKNIKRLFSKQSFVRAREENKKDLQKQFGLTPDAKRPLFAFCGRLAKQKGLDFIIEVLPHLLVERPDVQIVFLGSGEERYRLELTVLQKNFPDQIGLYLRPDFHLPRKIYAGADMVLIPSLFEPGGIVALEALRYGCVPIVRRTGGLNDVITDFNPATKRGNGFSFKQKDGWALFGTMVEALTTYQYPRVWKALVENCMDCDFSWNHAAVEYDTWYKRVLREKNHASDEEEHALFLAHAGRIKPN